MERDWIFLQNPFLNATEDNFSKFNSVINYSNTRFNAQAGDTFIDTIIAVLNPSCTAWNTTYAAWIASQGEHVSTTNTVRVLLDALSSEHSGSWVRKIAYVYVPGSSAYIRLLPRGSAPFQTGKQADRILAVSNLIVAIGSDVALAEVRTLASDFIVAITAAKTEQVADLTDTDNLSDACELQRIASGAVLWQTMGMMIAHFAASPDGIGNYYDQANLRASDQVSFTHTNNPLATATLVKRKLTDTMQIRVVNDSDADIRVFYAAEKNDAIGATYLTVATHQDVTVMADAIGTLATGHYIKVYNVSTLVDAHYTLTIIK
jgi:hypothetical protein